MLGFTNKHKQNDFGLNYCTISINSAGPVTHDRLPKHPWHLIFFQQVLEIQSQRVEERGSVPPTTMQVSGGTTTKMIGRMTLSRTLNNTVWENQWEHCDLETSLVFPWILRISDFQLITVDLLNSLTTTLKLQFRMLGNFLGLYAIY